MNNILINFCLKIIIVLGIAFGAHVFILNYLDLPMFENKIVASYIINTVLAIIIFTGLYAVRNKYKTQLGFLFIAGSALKFAVFFIVFYPHYKQDETITTLEFAAFFVPYILCLIIETFSLAKWLNKME